MQSKHFPFIYCIEKLVQERKYPLWESCFEELGLNPKPVTECYKGEAGKEVSFFSFYRIWFMYSYFPSTSCTNGVFGSKLHNLKICYKDEVKSMVCHLGSTFNCPFILTLSQESPH